MPQPLVSIRNLSVVFPGPLRAVDDVSLNIAAGETLGVVGESGSGKSTLAKTIVDLHRPTSGQILFEGQSSQALDRLWFRRQAQLVFQDAASSLSPRLTVRQLLEEPLRIHGLVIEEHWAGVGHLLGAIGLPVQVLDKYPHQVSGGQARRIAIARALVLKPRLLIADEPTAGLDVSIQGDLLNLLRGLQQSFGLTYLIVSHNLNIIRRVSDRVAVMYLGKLVEIGSTKSLFSRPAHPYTAALIGANPVIDPKRRRPRIVLRGEIPSPLQPPPGCRFHTRCRFVRDRCRSEVPPVARIAEGHETACHFPFVAVSEEGSAAIPHDAEI